MQRRDDQHVGIPLDHQVGVVGEPDGAELRFDPLLEAFDLLVPALVDG
jgi:hypothetical protein